MREEPIDVRFSEVREKAKPAWWSDPNLIEDVIRLLGYAALAGFVFFALNYGR
jgi:hypothetical protein